MEELKAGWRRVRLGDVIESISDTTKIIEDEVVLINTSDVYDGKVLNHQLVENKGLKGQFKKRFKYGDILYSEIRPINRRFAKIKFDSTNYLASTKLMILRKKENALIDEEYIYQLLKSDKIISELQQIAESRSGTFPQITFNELKTLEFFLPSLETQKKITSILSSLDEKIELNRKINQNLEETAQTLFKRWFIDFEFPNEEGKPYKSSGGKMIKSELGEIPEGWKIKNLLEVGDFINGLAMQKYRPLDTEDSLKVIKIKEMNSGFSKESELCSVNIPDTYKVNFGDILFSWSGTLKVMFWDKECGGLNQHIFKVIPKNVNKLFLYFWLKIHLQTFIQIAQSKATTMGHIKRNDLNNSKIIVPNTEFWIYKEKILNSYLEKIVYQSKEIEKLIELRDYLLPRLMNGEIDVSNLKISEILNSD